MRDVYKKAKYIIWKLCVSVSVLLLMWVRTSGGGTHWVCLRGPVAGRHHKALWVMSSAARAGFPHETDLSVEIFTYLFFAVLIMGHGCTSGL